jgi:hypothetical protein
MQKKSESRITPDWVSGLEDNEVFVFGSNTSGIHDAAAVSSEWRQLAAESIHPETELKL